MCPESLQGKVCIISDGTRFVFDEEPIEFYYPDIKCIDHDRIVDCPENIQRVIDNPTKYSVLCNWYGYDDNEICIRYYDGIPNFFTKDGFHCRIDDSFYPKRVSCDIFLDKVSEVR
ncbi:MAG: hypothetical protein ACTSUF_05370 [Candidatus Heimdallarchaeaceae archaeon]